MISINQILTIFIRLDKKKKMVKRSRELILFSIIIKMKQNQVQTPAKNIDSSHAVIFTQKKCVAEKLEKRTLKIRKHVIK